MDVTGAGLHNIETKWLYDFLTLEKCRNFSQAAIIRNVSQPAFSRRIRALEHAVGVNCLTGRSHRYSFPNRVKSFTLRFATCYSSWKVI